jgi:hypothetical protein
MIRKILSGGRTGVEMAALDVATKLGIDHGGWTGRGMRNEDGAIERRYGLKEVVAMGFHKAMEENVLHSDGTLVVTRGVKSIESQSAVESALRNQRQLLHVDLSQHPAFEAASLISSWVSMNNVLVAYITGPSAQQDGKIYRDVQKILETAIYLEFVKTGLHPDRPEQMVAAPNEAGAKKAGFPQTVEEAVQRLKQVLPLKDRTLLSNLQADELDHLHTGLGEYIKQNFGLYMDNEPLMASCADMRHVNKMLPDEACTVILRALWQDLRDTHKLRLVK